MQAFDLKASQYYKVKKFARAMIVGGDEIEDICDKYTAKGKWMCTEMKRDLDELLENFKLLHGHKSNKDLKKAVAMPKCLEWYLQVHNKKFW